MKLSYLLDGYKHKVLKGDTSIDIVKIENDSRKISKGDMFVAIKGFSVDGHNYVDGAIKNGAKCIVVEREIDIADSSLTVIMVKDTLDAIARFSSIFYGQPSNKLKLIGVTGTNGKTSTTYLIKEIFEEDGRDTAVIGTLGSKIGNELTTNKNTTPESLIIQSDLRKALDSNIDYCAMEVSSHALALKRVKYINFQVGIFTNLTEDHLDYHLNMEDYYQSKLKLFNMTNKCNIINADDSYGKRMIKEIENEVPIITYGMNESCNVYATDVVCHTEGLDFTLNTPKGSIPINMKLLGMFNLYNALAAISCGIAFDIDLLTIKKGIESMEGIKGRCERVPIEGKDFSVIIDYAHTPDGLEKILNTISQFAEGRIVVVFGAGGNRDKIKRPIMGEVVAKYADLCIVTSDNPRFEDPDKIIEDVVVGVKKQGTDYIQITDRREAIKYALENAKAKDTILLAGKGHETYTIIKDEVIPFDERDIILEILEDLE